MAQQARKREMRAAWIATVSNIDWPSSRTLSLDMQQKEMLNILNQIEANNMNTIIFQIRPTADAFFPSEIEPWSHWLTGSQGTMPDPYYDPLQFVIEQAHARCIDVHVWINPYRVTSGFDTSLMDPEHIFFKEPNLFVKYGRQWYFDPGYDETRAYLNRVVADVVKRYDIDAIHFDDYFYPYKVAGKDFPDTRSFMLNRRGYSKTEKEAWRRNNVDMIIAELQETIKQIKPWVEFGISPFGVWRNESVDPRGSATRAGVQNYDDLYADILKWLREGTIDYVMPQLYWEIGLAVADYEILCKWWSENSYGRNLYIGLSGYKLGLKGERKPWHTPNELARQLELNKYHPDIDGVSYYSVSTLMRNVQGINDSLQNNFYKYLALPPINRNIIGVESIIPQNVRLIKDKKNTLLWWDESTATDGNKVAYYVVYAFKGKDAKEISDPRYILLRTTKNYVDLRKIKQKLKGHYTFVVTSVNKYKHESLASSQVHEKL